MIKETYKTDTGEEREAILLCSECHGLITRPCLGTETWSFCEECRSVEQKTVWVDADTWGQEKPKEVYI